MNHVQPTIIFHSKPERASNTQETGSCVPNFILQTSAYRISRSNCSKVVVGNGDLKVKISCQLIMVDVDVVQHMQFYNVYAQHNLEAHNCSVDNACMTVS